MARVNAVQVGNFAKVLEARGAEEVPWDITYLLTLRPASKPYLTSFCVHVSVIYLSALHRITALRFPSMR